MPTGAALPGLRGRIVPRGSISHSKSWSVRKASPPFYGTPSRTRVCRYRTAFCFLSSFCGTMLRLSCISTRLAPMVCRWPRPRWRARLKTVWLTRMWLHGCRWRSNGWRISFLVARRLDIGLITWGLQPPEALKTPLRTTLRLKAIKNRRLPAGDF